MEAPLIIFGLVVLVILLVAIGAVFGRSSQEEELTPQVLDPFADKVKCAECYCWLDKRDAQKVEIRAEHSFDEWFCRADRKPYSEVHIFSFSQPARFFGRIEMTKEGEPVGYVKVKKSR